MMAVTSLKPVSYNVRTAINYVRNPEKTRAQGLEALAALHAVRGSIHYAEDNIKTERSLYVTHINCNEADAIQQFQSTKILWNKTRGRACYHGYQSFMEGEVTAEQAHAIGVELAKRLWGERFEVVVATRLNTNHYHNHFILNSVSWRDGYKFRNAPEDYAEMRRVSDELCREYGLSVVAPDPQSRHKSYGERMAEKQGRPTYVSMIRQDIDRAVAASTTERHFYSCMEQMGYEFKFYTSKHTPLKYPGLRPKGAAGFFRFYKLGDGYDLGDIRQRIMQNDLRRYPFPQERTATPRRCRMEKHPKAHIKGIRALYFRYCYMLGTITRHPTSVKRVPYSMMSDVTKLDRLIAEGQLLSKYKIETMDELLTHKTECEVRIRELIGQRNQLRNKIKRSARLDDGQAIETDRREIAEISAVLAQLRKEVKLCSSIEERSRHAALALKEIDRDNKTPGKENAKHEHVRRGRRAGREDDAERR